MRGLTLKVKQNHKTASGETAVKQKKYSREDLAFALESAAEFLENEEWPDESERESVESAYKEAAKRIRRMAAKTASGESNSER